MKLKDYLYFNKISVSKFARELGISRSYMSLVVNEKYMPSSRIAKIIEEATEGKVCCFDLIF